MPNRIIKESICRSDNLDRLSADEECFFYRLMVQCDDFGRYDGRAAIIKGACFPLKDRITTSRVEKMLDSLIRESLVFVYIIEGLPYIQMTKWGKHQQIRAKRSKYPEPDIDGNQVIADDGTCPRNPIQSNPILNPIQSESNLTPERKFTAANGKILKGDVLKRFEEFLEAFGSTAGKAPAANSWLKIDSAKKPVDEALFAKIIAGAKRYDALRPSIKQRGSTAKMAQGWLTDRRWDDEDTSGNGRSQTRDPNEFKFDEE